MPNEQEKFNRFLEEEFALLMRREFNTVINDLKEEESKNINDINESINSNKTLFTNYTELILYLDASNGNTNDYLKYDYVTLYGILGEAYFQREMYDESIKALDKAISMSPSNILLIQRKMFALKKLNLIDDLEKLLYKTFRYCYTRDALMNQYVLLSNVFEEKKMYKEAAYILYLIGVSFDNNAACLSEIDRIQKKTKESYNCPNYEELMGFLKEKNIMSPYDLYTYYYSFYTDMIKNNDTLGALDFLKCCNNVFYDKHGVKKIKKLSKQIEKARKKQK